MASEHALPRVVFSALALLLIIFIIVPFTALMGGSSLAQTFPSGQPATTAVGVQHDDATVTSVAPAFLPVVLYDSGGTNAYSIAVADFNGDGYLDVVVANSDSNNIGVLMGNGDGTFQPAATYSSGGSEPMSVAVADLNRDGHPDIVVANACRANNCTGNVAVLLNKGNGTFAQVATYGSGGDNPTAVAISDADHDGKPDLLLANLVGGRAGVLMGNGDGTFRAATTYDTGGFGCTSIAALGPVPVMVVANAYNSSGKPRSNVAVLYGYGDGTFGPAVTYASGGYTPSSIAVGDVYVDGAPDIVVANAWTSTARAGNGNVGVLLNLGGDVFLPPFRYGSGGENPVSVTLADVNLDGMLDLVIANWGARSISVLEGTGLGGNSGFQHRFTFSTGGLPQSVVSADVNGDGKADLLVADANGASGGDGAIGVLLNKTVIPTATSTVLTSSLNPAIYGQTVAFTVAVTPSGSVTPTGTVSFTYGGGLYKFGSAKLNDSGVATLIRYKLAANTYALTATYKGDTYNLSSSSTILNQTVSQATSTATIASTPNPSTIGQTVTFTAEVTSPTVRPSGSVTLTAGTTVLGTVPLFRGKATLATSTLSAGSTTIEVNFPGDANIAGRSASLIQVVQ